MKIAFFGTPQFAADILSGTLAFPEIEICLVVSQPDMPVWRKQELLATPVKQKALENEVAILQPESLKKNKMFQEHLKTLGLDFIVVVAYGKIIPKSILDIPKYGCLNIHGSILPKYRGASPVQEALKNGDRETWLTTMYMSEKMDEGDILKIAKIEVDILDTSESIFQKFTQIGPKLLLTTLQEIYTGKLQSIPQNHTQATYCTKISKEEGAVFFRKQKAWEIYNLFRAYTPWPGIYTFYEGKRLVLGDVFLYIKPQSDPTHTKPHLWISSPWGEEDYSFRQAYTKVPEYIKVLSKNLRQGQTDSEKIVWEMLRNRKFYNLKFRRQHAIGRYIADFYCDEKKLIIELDGKIHENQQEYDKIRDEIISSHTIHIIRIPNQDIEKIHWIIYSELCSLSLLWGERIQERGFVWAEDYWSSWQFLKLAKNRYGIICADRNILELIQIKPEGKKSMDIASFVNGNKDIEGYRFW